MYAFYLANWVKIAKNCTHKNIITGYIFVLQNCTNYECRPLKFIPAKLKVP